MSFIRSTFARFAAAGALATVALLGAGTLFLCAVEWSNPATLGPMRADEKLLAGFFQSTIARTAGFNSIDISAMHPVSWLGLDLLMLIGGGPAGTAGGLKVTTKNAWFAARPSGTEDVYKIYAESFLGAEHLKRVQAEAQQIVDAVIS